MTKNSHDAPAEFIKRVGFRLFFEHSPTKRFAEFLSVLSVGWLGLRTGQKSRDAFNMLKFQSYLRFSQTFSQNDYLGQT